MPEQKDRGPGVIIPPPVICVFPQLITYFVEQNLSMQICKERSELIVLTLAVLAILIAAASVFKFWQAKTNIEPWHPDQNLITDGVFSYSRNPVYLALVLLTSALVLYFNSYWAFSALLISVAVLQFYVIPREENYLLQLFGEDYLQYKKRVRRWL